MEATKPRARGLPKNRLETLVDGVFAIAMTLLVLELRLPETPSGGSLAEQLAALWPAFATFSISFIVLGVYWFAHHQVFHFVGRVNRTLVWINIAFLMGIALVPFVASLMGRHPDDVVALAFYGAVLAALAALGYLSWWYLTTHRGLLEHDLDPDLVRRVRVWLAAGPIIALAAIGVAFVSTTASFLIYLALPALFIFLNPVNRYFDRLREEEESRRIEPPSRSEREPPGDRRP